MTLQDIKERCDELGLKYQYGFFEDNIEPPYLVGVIGDSNNFVADNVVFKKVDTVDLYYTYKVKDLTIEEKIEDELLADVVWRKNEETYYVDEEVWQVIYTFNI